MRVAEHFMREPEGNSDGPVYVRLLPVKQGYTKEVQGTLAFGHASYLYPFPHAEG